MKQFSKDLGNVSLAPKGKWSREQEYERLNLVYNACDNLSYVAKINVPSGVDIENREYWQPMNATGYADNNFINLTAENENGIITAYETLEEAVATILPINRRAGATLSFYNLNADRLDRQAEFELWQFNSTDLANWENIDYWNNIYYNWNVFAGWYVGADALKNHVKIPNVGQYAYVGSNLNDALLYQCRTNGTWTNTGIKVRNYISVVVGGNITIGENGNWFSNGEDTGIPATPSVDEQLDNISLQLQQHTTEIDELQRQDVALKSNIDSNFEIINNKVDNIKTATDNKIDAADENLQNQITSNDTDIATLNTKHESLSRTVQGIAATGGASTANNVTYTNDSSGLNAENAQDAIDELQGSKIDKASISQESGDAEDKVMSQKAVSKTIIGSINRIDFLSKQSFLGFLSHGILEHYISPDKNIRKNKGSYIYIVYLQEGYTITFNYSSNRKGVTLDGGAYKKDIKSTNDIISTNCIAELSQNTAYTATEDCIVAIPYFPQDYPTTPISVVISNGETSYKLHGSDYFDKDTSFKDLLSNFGTSYKEHYTSAALMFCSKIKVGSIVYARLVTDAKIDVAKCLVNDNEIGIKLTKDFQKIDLSKYSTGRFQVYASFDKEADVTLEVISATLLADAINDNKAKLDYAVNLKNRGHYSMTSISVKKDGTGDFTSIQEAINSITDASPINQYDIMVYDDFIIKDLTELYSEYGTKNTNNGIDVPLSSNCALFATKNWVNVRGVGRKIELSIISPSNLAAESFKFIQTILLQGNCTVENFKVTIKGGRYAIHQDKNGAKSSIDYCATTTLKNVDVIHYGNKDYVNGKSWTATCAQANGTCDGLKLIYKNCTWYSKETAPFYTHAGYDMDEPSKLYFEGCSMYRAKETSLYDSSPYFGDLGSGKELEVEIVGCNFRHFRGFTESNICGYEKARVYDDVRLGGVMMHGHSNAKMTLNKRFMKCLTFRTTAKNKSIKVIGGSAFDDIFGGVYKHYDCAPDAVGEESGIRKIFDASTTNVYSLAYRLGNCKTSPKTLSIEVDGEAHDITFSNNYMTTDGSSYNETTKPALNNSAIVREINEQLSSLGVSCDINCNDGFKYFEDQELYICNNSDETFMINDFLVKDGAEFIKANSSNYKNIVAIVAERINIGSCGRIIYINNCYIPLSGEKGTMYKLVNNTLVPTNNIDEAKFIQVDSYVIEMIK